MAGRTLNSGGAAFPGRIGGPAAFFLKKYGLSPMFPNPGTKAPGLRRGKKKRMGEYR